MVWTREYLPYDKFREDIGRGQEILEIQEEGINGVTQQGDYLERDFRRGVIISFTDGLFSLGVPAVISQFLSQKPQTSDFNISSQIRFGQYVKYQYPLSGKLANLTGIPFFQKQVQDITTFESTCTFSSACSFPFMKRVSSEDLTRYRGARIMKDKVLLGNNSLSLVRCLWGCSTKTDDDEVEVDD